jgi:hypothetical protein
MIAKLISGGQTGVDRAALDAALRLGIPCGGFCPRGRRAEDGPIPWRYPLTEIMAEDYPTRTRRNIESADAILILHEEFPLPTSPGTLLTLRLARESGKPWRSIYIGTGAALGALNFAAEFLAGLDGKTLMVAGPRESKCPGIYDRALAFLLEVLAP